MAYMAVVFFGILLYFGLNNFDALKEFVSWLISIISPFISAAIIAFLLNIPMRFFESSFLKNFRVRRTMAILLSYFSAFVLIFLLSWLVAPQIVESARSLLANATQYLENLNNLVDYVGNMFDIEPAGLDQFRLSYEDVINQLFNLVLSYLPDILGMSLKIGSGLISVLTSLIASIYMLASKEKLSRQFRRVLYAFTPKQAADETVRIFKLSGEVFSGFLGGKIVDSVFIGLICFIGMSLINATFIEMPFTPLISVIIAVTNIIPFFGPFIGAIPSAMILLMVNPMSALWFTLFIIILQQFDGNILGPRILGVSIGLPPLWVLIGIIAGGGLFGFPGMIAGVPVVAILYTLIREIINKRLRAAGFDDDATLIPARAEVDGIKAAKDNAVIDGDKKKTDTVKEADTAKKTETA